MTRDPAGGQELKDCEAALHEARVFRPDGPGMNGQDSWWTYLLNEVTNQHKPTTLW